MIDGGGIDRAGRGRLSGLARRLLPWGVVALAGALRLADLEVRPLHHDEGSNAIFLEQLLSTGTFRYDPANYHGPLPFYLGAAALRLGGRTTFMLRLAPALGGTAIVALAVFGLRRRIGGAGALAAGLLLATSPSLVYYSRDSIHEIPFVLLTLVLALVAGGGDAAPGRGRWMAAGAAAGGLLATKETAPFAFAALLAAALAGPGRGGGRRPPAAALAWAALAAFLVALPLYTQFFRDPEGALAPFRAVRPWVSRALAGEGHEKPWWYFAALLLREEWAILVPAGAGAVLAVRWRDARARGCAAWAGVTLAIYSLIPYKTPWLVLNAVLPLGLLAGSAFAAAWRPPSPRRRALAGTLLAALAACAAARAVDLAFVRHDAEGASRLIYVQTRRETLDLVARIEAEAARDPAGRDLPIAVLSPDYLPLNWYLRDFTSVAYHGRDLPEVRAAIIIARADEADRIGGRLGPAYARSEYDLRPGVRLALFVRRPDPAL